MKNFTHAVKGTINMVVIKKEVLSPSEFLHIHKTKPGVFKTAEFVAPKIGGKGFGAFEVEYRTPRLVAEHE